MALRASFLSFCVWLGVTLTPGQRVLCAVAYDGQSPGAASTEESRQLALRIFGAVEAIPAEARSVVNAVCGRGAGKSYTLIALRLLWGALARDLSGLARGEVGYAPIVAPQLKLARQTLNFIRGALADPRLSPMVVAEAKDDIVIQRPDGRRVSFSCLAAGRAGAALRGKSFTDAAFEEAAFFRDEDTGVVNDAELFNAVSPRILPGGQIILVSSPWAEVGLFYDLHKENWGHPTAAIAAHAPTLVLNDNEKTREMVAREQVRDPDNASREYGAEFLGSGAQQFFESGAVDAAVSAELIVPRKALPGEFVTVGADFGFRSDSSAVVVVHRSVDGEHYWVGDVLELRPQEGKPLKPSATVQRFAQLVKGHGAGYVMADQHYRETIAEHLAAEELGFLDAPAGSLAADPFVRARMLFREGKVHLPDDPRLRSQLKAVVGKALPGGGLRIVQPRLAKGGHGDLVSALVLALHQAGGIEVERPWPKPGTEEWAEEQRRELLERDTARHERAGKAEWWENIGEEGGDGF